MAYKNHLFEILADLANNVLSANVINENNKNTKNVIKIGSVGRRRLLEY